MLSFYTLACDQHWYRNGGLSRRDQQEQDLRNSLPPLLLEANALPSYLGAGEELPSDGWASSGHSITF